jgi:hypothetical protein
MSGKTRSRRGPTRTEGPGTARPVAGGAPAAPKREPGKQEPGKRSVGGAAQAKAAARTKGATGRSRIGQRGRATSPEATGRRPSGRYTPPVPKSVKRSPRWYPWVLLGLLLVGVLCIILNYIQVLPASPTNWYVVGGLVAILAAALMATSYR